MSEERGVRARCRNGGPAPCVDDLCNNVDYTLCGLEYGYDFCEHKWIPETCPECSFEDDDYQDGLDDGEEPA